MTEIGRIDYMLTSTIMTSQNGDKVICAIFRKENLDLNCNSSNSCDDC